MTRGDGDLEDNLTPVLELGSLSFWQVGFSTGTVGVAAVVVVVVAVAAVFGAVFAVVDPPRAWLSAPRSPSSSAGSDHCLLALLAAALYLAVAAAVA